MTTPLLQLEIQGAAGNFTFLVPPQLVWRRALHAKAASNAHVTEEIVDTLNLRGALLVSTDGTVATLWSQWTAFLGRFESRTAAPTYARITRDPGGSNTVVATLGPPTYERLRFESIEAGSSPYQSQAGHWKVCIPVDLVVSAVLKLADADTGIVRLDQEVKETYDEGGLLTVEWTTTVTTAEGTDARAKARTYGLIPIASWGDSYSYLTNGDDGVEITVPDADEENSRTPTVATGVCRVKQWGVTIGTSGPGVSPSTVVKTIRTRSSDSETVTSYEVSAVGPGAEAWVKNQLPAYFAASDIEFVDEQATRRYSATWTQRANGGTAAEGIRRTVRIQVQGGHADPRYEPALGGYLPVRFTTARQAWTVTLDVVVEGTGTPLRSQMQFPAPLGAAAHLFLDRGASTEDLEPVPAGAGSAASAGGPVLLGGSAVGTSVATTRYRREARLVYRGASAPPANLGQLVQQGGYVESYYLTS